MEIKIALGFFALSLVSENLVPNSDFFIGIFMGLFLFFLILGILPEKYYTKYKDFQKRKLSFFSKQ
jgi:hypothetical protein